MFQQITHSRHPRSFRTADPSCIQSYLTTDETANTAGTNTKSNDLNPIRAIRDIRGSIVLDFTAKARRARRISTADIADGADGTSTNSNSNHMNLIRDIRAIRGSISSSPSVCISVHPWLNSSRRTRRGSVLLMVVVLLLILAILGTAYLATTRTDRIASAQDVTNGQIDQISDSVRSLATSYIVNSLFAYNNLSGAYIYKPSSSLVATGGYVGGNLIYNYNNYDIPDYLGTPQGATASDSWLADRIPSAGPTWAAITAPLNSVGLDATRTYTTGLFESPIHTAVIPGGAPQTYSGFTNATPTFFPFTANGITTSYPALTIGGTPYVAGDADGDGIADCGLIRLPGIYNDGLTYYAGIRIIDNNSAINVNTAWDDQFDYDFSDKSLPPSSAQVFPSFYPSAVGLSQLLNGYNGATVATPDPLSNSALAPIPPSPLPLYRLGIGGAAGLAQPVTDSHALPTDFAYSSLGDAMYHQLSRRLGNPGFRDTFLNHYQAYGEAEGAALAYHFGLLNPISFNPGFANFGFGTGILDQTMNFMAVRYPPNVPLNASMQSTNIGGHSSTTYGNAPWKAYPPSAAVINQWYLDLTSPPSGGSTPMVTNARPYLVTHNAVSNFAPVNSNSTLTAGSVPAVPAGMLPYGDRGRWQSNVIYTANSATNSADAVTFAYTNGGTPTGPSEETSSQFYYYASASATSANPPAIQATGMANTSFWTQTAPPGLPTPALVKANINTALFPELQRAYWNVMYAGMTAGNNMFRSPIGYDPRPGTQSRESASAVATNSILSSQQMLMLRASLAAANAETMRMPGSPPNDVVGRLVNLGGNPSVSAVVYGNQPQVYITEVYVQTDSQLHTTEGQNPVGYIAVELYNPSSNDITLVGAGHADDGWALAFIDRSKLNKSLVALTSSAVASPNPGLALTSANYPGATDINLRGVPIVPAKGFLILENYRMPGPDSIGTASAAAYRPKSTLLPLTGAIAGANVVPSSASGLTHPINTLYVPNLVDVTASGGSNRELVILRRRNAYGSTYSGTDFVGTTGGDSWDDTQATLLANTANDLKLDNYVPVDSFDFTPTAVGSLHSATIYHYVRYKAAWGYVYPGLYNRIQPGMFSVTPWDPSGAADADPGAANPVSQLGSLAAPAASYSPTFTIQLSSPNWAFPTKASVAPTVNQFPFGQFARNGDMLAVPYIGCYVVYGSGGIIDVNSVTMDASFADDQESTNFGVEQVGRFCPNPAGADLAQFKWAKTLFDYLTVQSPRDDYMPACDPTYYPGTTSPIAVANADPSAAANTNAENTVGVEGLVNINTAPLAVLESLPLAVDNTGKVDANLTATIAANIVAYRKTTPFTSIFDLNLNAVGSFQSNADTTYGSTTVAQGNINPPSNGGTSSQFDEQYLNMTRLSNLITTRSDTFTVYIVVEGWQNAGSTNLANPPQLMLTQRTAFTIDRNSVTPNSRVVRTVPIPNN